MQLTTEAIRSPALPSATVVLLRDGADGLEVFLLKRHGLSDVLGGAYVFPGGKVDAEDAEWADRLDTAPAALHAALGEPELDGLQAAALYVAAIREVFEETGLLFAPVTPAQAQQAWAALRTGPRFSELLEPWGLVLQAGALHPWSRWVTPQVGGVVRKRFDTRFFVAAVPPGQVPAHDQHEAVESLWLAPGRALTQYWEGGIELAPPQIMSLAHLARHRNVASVLEAARARQPPCIRPEPFEQEGERVLCYPGDPRHSLRERALPGPTRLHWRNDRFEPEGGLRVLLSDA
ncbi:NUDIX hydrolase [Caenimonas sedimenti]|uniref:NUDIX hydrolase n=1 Tax=Caenimonas sedimenti TaxID=2596921 RepID=A0A562ZMK8_9BURK|nr:NUDIX domain-containing protein [Caenimonas sedimenti]TWO69404.1 NUDIX hydrolase [Caenimonas sedimenti]